MTASGPGRPRLRWAAAPSGPLGVVLLLPGGPDDSTHAAQAWDLAALRMVPVARRVVAAGEGCLAVARLQYRVRGWNQDGRSVVEDAGWAIAEARARFGEVPVSLIGHSMGGRVAVRAAGASGVVSVVGMAPWLPPDEPVEPVAGRRVLIVHGEGDHTTDPAQSQAFLRQAEPVAERVNFVLVRGAWHSLLRHRRLSEGLVAGYAAATLRDEPPADPRGQTGNAEVANLLHQVFTGTGPLEI